MTRPSGPGPQGLRAERRRPIAGPVARPLLHCALAAALMPGAAWALEIGRLQWRPGSGGIAAHAEILLRDQVEIDPAGIRARLGVKESYQVAGLTYLPAFAQVQVKPARRDDGRVVLRVEGLPADAPRLDLLVTVTYKLKMTLAEFRVDPRRGAAEFTPMEPGAQLARQPAPSSPAALPAPAEPLPKAENSLAPGAAGERSAAADAGSSTVTPQATAHAALQGWAEAWSRRDVDAYLAAYAPDHVGRGAPDAQAWRTQRRARIEGRSRIEVRLSGLRARAEAGRIVATFVQSYRADGLQETVRKRVVLAPSGERWLIVEESELR